MNNFTYYKMSIMVNHDMDEVMTFYIHTDLNKRAIKTMFKDPIPNQFICHFSGATTSPFKIEEKASLSPDTDFYYINICGLEEVTKEEAQKHKVHEVTNDGWAHSLQVAKDNGLW